MPFQKGNKLSNGRPVAQHTLAKEEARRIVIRKVHDNLLPILDAKLDLALGHYRVGNVKGSTIRIYKVSPDGNAIQYLLNQTIDKPTESIKVDEDVSIKIDI